MKKRIFVFILIIMSIVSAIITVKVALGIVEKTIDSELGFLQTNPMPLFVCLLIGGAISLFSLAKVKKVFLTLGVYYIGILLSITCFYYAIVAYLLQGGMEYILTYACIGIIMIGVTQMMANVIKMATTKK